MPDQHRPQVIQLTSGELDRYANQLARCLKALDTGAPIRAQRILARPGRSAPPPGTSGTSSSATPPCSAGSDPR
jgi:hypothetical protein